MNFSGFGSGFTLNLRLHQLIVFFYLFLNKSTASPQLQILAHCIRSFYIMYVSWIPLWYKEFYFGQLEQLSNSYSQSVLLCYK